MKKGAKRLAREMQAKQEGVSEAAIRKRLQREQWRKNMSESDPILSPWCELDEDFKKRIRSVVDQSEAIAKAIDKVLVQVTALQFAERIDDMPAIHVARLARLAEELSTLSVMAKGLVPKMVCPDCKGQTEAQKQCVPCSTTGYITNNQVAGVSPELMSTETPMIRFGGELILLSAYLGEPEEEPMPDLIDEPEDDNIFGFAE